MTSARCPARDPEEIHLLSAHSAARVPERRERDAGTHTHGGPTAREGWMRTTTSVAGHGGGSSPDRADGP